MDFLVERAGKVVLAIEVKSGKIDSQALKYPKFREHFPHTPLLVASREADRKRSISDEIAVWPWKDVLEELRQVGRVG